MINRAPPRSRQPCVCFRSTVCQIGEADDIKSARRIPPTAEWVTQARGYCSQKTGTKPVQVQHDRTAFSCGIAQVDNYFHKTVNKLAQADTIRLGVMVDAKKWHIVRILRYQHPYPSIRRVAHKICAHKTIS